MNVKTYCPFCGVHTTVQMTQEESVHYYRSKKFPSDIEERSICLCCSDDGLKSTNIIDSYYKHRIRV